MTTSASGGGEESYLIPGSESHVVVESRPGSRWAGHRGSLSEALRPIASATLGATRGRLRGLGPQRVVQPVWVVDQAGLIRFANASALPRSATTPASDLLGEPGHQTFHCERPDGTALPGRGVPERYRARPGRTIHGGGLPVPSGWLAAPGRVLVGSDRPARRPRRRGVVHRPQRTASDRAGARERDAILSALGQPVWVVRTGGDQLREPGGSHDLGFGDASELLGQNAHWQVHYKRPRRVPSPVEDCPLTQVRAHRGGALSRGGLVGP